MATEETRISLNQASTFDRPWSIDSTSGRIFYVFFFLMNELAPHPQPCNANGRFGWALSRAKKKPWKHLIVPYLAGLVETIQSLNVASCPRMPSDGSPTPRINHFGRHE